MSICDVYNKVKKEKEVDENPRVCDICGCVETMYNLMLKYDNGKIMCDDCAFIAFVDDADYSELCDCLGVDYL